MTDVVLEEFVKPGTKRSYNRLPGKFTFGRYEIARGFGMSDGVAFRREVVDTTNGQENRISYNTSAYNMPYMNGDGGIGIHSKCSG